MNAVLLTLALLGQVDYDVAHTTLTKSGRIWWSFAQQQGYMGGRGTNWAIMSMNPDGTDWQPEVSAFDASWRFGLGDQKDPLHFQTETTDGSNLDAIVGSTCTVDGEAQSPVQFSLSQEVL